MMITVSRQLDALRREDASLEDAIKEAEGRFRDQELEHDWSGQPIEEDGAADEKRSPPPCWKAGIDLAAPIAVAYAKAQLGTGQDPATFERFTEDVVAVVAQNTFFSKLSEYMRNPYSISSLVVDQFIADVRAATRRPMKELLRDVWKRRDRPNAGSDVGAPAPGAEIAPIPPPAARKKPRRAPHPNPETLLTGRLGVTYRTASEVLGITERRVRELVSESKLATRGQGQRKLIDVASLRKHAGL